eukprot:c26370_g1_i1 orf=79-1659(+)
MRRGRKRGRESLFSAPGKARRQESSTHFPTQDDEELVSSSSSSSGSENEDVGRMAEAEDSENEDGFGEAETADEKRLRIAKSYLEKIRTFTKRGDEDEREVEDGQRDSLVANLLRQEQLEERGRVQRSLAARVVEPSSPSRGRNVGRRHSQSVTCITLTEDDSRGFSASKDGLIIHWDIESGLSEKYEWPSKEDLTSSAIGNSQSKFNRGKGKTKHGIKHTLALAVTSDGRYLATGGLDQMIHLWDTRTREHLQAFPGHRDAVSCLTFRQGTQQLMSGSFDRSIKLWSVEDRTYIDTLYGHQSEVLVVDCLRQERVLSAGRDRTLRLWKIPDETQLVFRGHAASMDCCCFVTNSDFLSGSDDGCVALWSMLKKKPVFVVKNAHNMSVKEGSALGNGDATKDEQYTLNGHVFGNGNLNHSFRVGDSMVAMPGGLAQSWVASIAVCKGSDLAASGAGNGFVRLWAVEGDNRSLRALYDLPVKGFVNSLAFARSGRFLLSGVGQEPRLGRWGRIPNTRNGVIMHAINLV